MTELLVLINGNLAGRAFADRRGRSGFLYDDAWRNSRDAIPLSLSLPLANNQHDSDAVAAVLWGFLPDTEHVLQRWAARFHVSPRNPLTLLGHVGEGGVSWLIVGLLLAGGLPGLLVGSRLAQRLPVAQLRQGFAVLVVVLGVTLLASNLPKALG